MQAEPSSGRPTRTLQRQRQDAVVTVLLVALLAVAYYLVPVPGPMRTGSWAVIYGAGVVVLGLLIVVSVAKLLRAGPDVRARALVLLIFLALLFFSWTDVLLAKEPGQFVGLHTKTDALYFSVSTLATVGFGDVHASGQFARAAITVQILFNLVFLGVVVAFLTGMLRTRASRRLHQTGSGTATGSGSGSG